MNIYLVERTDSVNYDEYDSFVCYAENEQKAIETFPKNNKSFSDYDEFYNCWIEISKIDTLKVTLVGAHNGIKTPSVILSSFNAG
jgi:hypothetical protein